MTQSQPLGIGLYSLVDASRILKTPRRTISRWVDGYISILRDGYKVYDPVIGRRDGEFLTFGDLVELMYVRGFRTEGVRLDEIRDTAAKFREQWKTPYPLASRSFATDGKRLLIELGGHWQHALTGQHSAFFEDIGRHLVHIGDLACEWRPMGKDRTVLLNPDRSFGKPIDDLSGAHTFVLANAFRGQKDADEVAWWFGTSRESVLDAVEFEESLLR